MNHLCVPACYTLYFQVQRQKDAKELANMRKNKDKTEKENEDMWKKHDSSAKSLKKVLCNYNYEPILHQLITAVLYHVYRSRLNILIYLKV